MRKKLIKAIIFIVFLEPIFVDFSYVEALGWSNSQPPVCDWPSEMMSNYFNFQQEMKFALLWSEVQEKRFNSSVWTWWLFWKESLKLPSALDLVASSIVGGVKSTVSTAGTSAVLLVLAAKSVLQSNTEWFAILFKDRPIVRDYKTMLGIETDLFNLAYFRSKQMNLTLSLEKQETYDKLNEIIEKYQWLWLLYKWAKMQKTESFASILEELIEMNTVMKHFILFWWDPWDRSLKNYNWCFWNATKEACKSSPILKFDSKAIDQLKKDYTWLWTFGACNLSFSDFKKSIKKSINNNSDSVKASFDDAKMAMDRLKKTLLGTDKSKPRTNSRCEDLSDYEIAQLRAYWGPDWKCKDTENVSFQLSQTKSFFKNKTAQNDQRKKNSNLLKKSAATNMTNNNVDDYEYLKWEDTNMKKLEQLGRTSEKNNFWFQVYWEGEPYNVEFITELANNLMSDYEQMVVEYNQAQWNAASSDLSPQLKKIRWLLEQVNTAIWSSDREKWLEYWLRKVADKQCR